MYVLCLFVFSGIVAFRALLIRTYLFKTRIIYLCPFFYTFLSKDIISILLLSYTEIEFIIKYNILLIYS